MSAAADSGRRVSRRARAACCVGLVGKPRLFPARAKMDVPKWRPDNFCPILRRSADLELSLAHVRAQTRAHARFSGDSPASTKTDGLDGGSRDQCQASIVRIANNLHRICEAVAAERRISAQALRGGADRIRTLSSLLELSDEQSLGEFQRPAPDSSTALFSAEAAFVYVYYLDFFLFTRS